ncbi:inter-alpha-trypsin inhibitor heavy chain h3 [Plakobranchus ocellatus]|uniref:Inter-alpha-trypsin inhibitor heavy chain h3 n=1 Tax=Plakobranchus ocellatus TaxID=259542 RepID=A0AAV4B0K1_9GAST|nr:inter-alpha-trypsin inhibitor heavy chain h3 [Plakobranchus ocellatus]
MSCFSENFCTVYLNGLPEMSSFSGNFCTEYLDGLPKMANCFFRNPLHSSPRTALDLTLVLQKSSSLNYGECKPNENTLFRRARFWTALKKDIEKENGSGKRKSSTLDEEKRAGQSSGQTTRQTPRDTDAFEVSIKVPASKAATFTLTYQQMLQRRNGLYEYEIFINPGQVVPDLLIHVGIKTNHNLTFVRTPALRTDDLIKSRFETDGNIKLNDLAIINRTNPTTASIQYKPSASQQGDAGISATFVVQYGMEQGHPGGDVVIIDNYFAHFIITDFSASIVPKDIIFVLDKSGSMKGDKITQLKAAMDIILADILPQDRINIIDFSYGASRWKSSLVKAEQNQKQQAQSYVNSIAAVGGTNINDALLAALSDLTGQGNKERVSMIFFLTDGEPTEGEQDPDAITQNVANANDGTVSIYCLGFGKGADFALLKTLCAQNDGFTKEIIEDSDAPEQVSGLYKEISVVSIKDLRINYDDKTVDKSTLTQTSFPVVFNGSEISIYGRLQEGSKTVKYEITGSGGAGEMNISAEVDRDDAVVAAPIGAQNQDSPGIIEKMWVLKTINEKLSEKDKYAPTDNRTKELLEDVFLMSFRYQIVTPLTSMVVDLPDQGRIEIKEATQGDDFYEFSIYNFTLPPTPTTTTSASTIPINISSALFSTSPRAVTFEITTPMNLSTPIPSASPGTVSGHVQTYAVATFISIFLLAPTI